MKHLLQCVKTFRQFITIRDPIEKHFELLEKARNQMIAIISGVYEISNFTCSPTMHYGLTHFFDFLLTDFSAFYIRNEGIESQHKQTKKKFSWTSTLSYSFGNVPTNQPKKHLSFQ